MAEVYKVVYREFKRAGGGGADGHVVGLNCSINPRCVDIVLTWMQANGKAVLDFGWAGGMFLVCCSLAGARGIGVKLPDNKGQKYIFLKLPAGRFAASWGAASSSRAACHYGAG